MVVTRNNETHWHAAGALPLRWGQVGPGGLPARSCTDTHSTLAPWRARAASPWERRLVVPRCLTVVDAPPF